MTRFLFPVALILLELGAAIMYGIAGDWRKVAFWTMSAGIAVVVTW